LVAGSEEESNEVYCTEEVGCAGEGVVKQTKELYLGYWGIVVGCSEAIFGLCGLVEKDCNVGIWLWALAHGPIQILKFSWPIHA
jgi:hypothetical protein